MWPNTIPLRPAFTLLALLHSPLLLAEAVEPAGISAGSFVQTFFGLLLIVGLIVGLAWYARKLSGGQAFGKGLVKVIGGVSLGPRDRIMLVEVGDQWLVIGLVPGQIRTLHTMPKGELPAEALQAGDAPFAAWLKHMMEKRKHEG